MNHPSDDVKRGALSIITDALPKLNKTSRKTAEYILNHPRDTINLTITGLGKRTGVSDASIVRFAQSIGYPGFHALKIALAEDIVSPSRLVHEDIGVQEDGTGEIVRKIFTAGMRAIEDTAKILDPKQIQEAARAIIEARKIEIFAIGNSIPMAMDLNFRLIKIGLPSHSSIDPTLQAMSASLMTSGDVAIGISHMGSSKDTVYALELAQKTGATTICLTNHSDSPITHISKIHLFTATRETFFREEETTSNLAALAIIEALYVSICTDRFEESIKAARRALHATESRKF